MKLYEKMSKDNTALLVIDVINSCAHEKCEQPEIGIYFSKIREMVPRLDSFINEYRYAVGGLVVFTNTVPWKKEFLADNINELYTDPNTTYYSKDDMGFAEEFYQVEPAEDDLVITKNTYDAFAGTQLDEKLREKGIQYLVVTGIFGDGCVMATICGGFSLGYNYVILNDLIETPDSSARQKLQASLKERAWPIMYGKTIKADEFLSGWKELVD